MLEKIRPSLRGRSGRVTASQLEITTWLLTDRPQPSRNASFDIWHIKTHCVHVAAPLWLQFLIMAKTKKAPIVPALKDDVVRIRINAEEKQALVATAARDGLQLSMWLRRLALREAGLLPGGGKQ